MHAYGKYAYSQKRKLQLIKARKLTFHIFSDPGNQIAAQFGLVATLPEIPRTIYLTFGIDLPQYNADDSWTLPLAARFIIDRQAIIRYAETDADYAARPEAEDTLKALAAIKPLIMTAMAMTLMLISFYAKFRQINEDLHRHRR